MKNKTPLILGGIFIILVVLFLVTSINPPEKSKGAAPLFEGEKPVIDKLEMTNKNQGRIVIEKQDGIWNIIEPIKYKASESTVEQSITTLLGTVVDGVISSRTESQEQFEVSDSTGTALKVYSGGEIVLDAIVGKNSIDLNHTYARMKDSDDIVIWRGMMTAHVSRPPDEWRDKGIYSFNPDDIVALKAVDGNNTREITLADSLWVYSENGAEKPVDQDSVKELVSLLSSLQCDAFADEKDIPRVAGKEADTAISFTVRNGDTHSFDLWTPGDADAGRYLIRKENGNEVFRFYRYRGAQLIIDYENLKAGAGEG